MLTRNRRALPDVITTPDLIRPLLAKSHAFVLIQNGIGIELDLQRAVPHATIISGCAYIDSTAVDGGKTIRQTNKVNHMAAAFVCEQTSDSRAFQSHTLFWEPMDLPRALQTTAQMRRSLRWSIFSGKAEA